MTLQTANNATGNQAYSGVGVEFAVNSSILVYDLGIFDSGKDGIEAPFTAPLSAYLLTSTGSVISSITFDSTSQGTLDSASGYRFKPITPVNLTPGTYILAGYGWAGNDLEHNCFLSSISICDTFVTLMTSLYGGGNDPAGTLPINPTSSIGNYFSAANMQFDAATVPEPASLSFFSLGLLALGFSRRKRGLKSNGTKS